MTKGRWILALIIVVLVGFATARGLKPRPPPPVDVSTAPVTKQDLTQTVNAAGHLQARETVKVSSNVTGDLLSLSVKEGDHVKEGQVLGQIDKRLGEAQVAQFRGAVAAAVAQTAQVDAAIEQDKRDLARLEKLVAENLATQADLEKAQTQLRLDEARRTAQRQIAAQNQGQLETALYNLSRATLKAPVEGTILELYHKVGERIRGSDFTEDVVLLIGGLNEMEVKAEVGEHEVVSIAQGNEAIVDIDALPDKQFKGRVVAVAKNAQIKNPGTDAEVTTFFVRVALEHPPEGALPGMSAAVSIATATRSNALTVPIQAITSRQPKPSEGQDKPETEVAKTTENAAASVPSGKPKPSKVVFVVKDGKVEMRPVRTGIASRTHVEILEGLSEGEVIVEGPYRTLARELKDGQEVKELPKGGPGGNTKGPSGEPM
ncbi:MAG: efflux RND transporter periplasmic adaptor subunit [Polyangiaceae bacterium]|nr:efflux RND transporter periplasmic adaptor subunit [Polyangiaceae bacterium]NUQ74629.1 efflux RND transporter periplasmic adaptor subunit [Polyangiaceae bacterium]